MYKKGRVFRVRENTSRLYFSKGSKGYVEASSDEL